MKKLLLSLFVAVALVGSPVAVMAQTSTTTPSRSHNGFSVTPCYYLLGIGAKWCEVTPQVAELWAQPEVRDALRAMYIAFKAN